MDHIKLGLSALAIAAISAPAAFARDQIQTAGSSTVLPYATIVAEAFGENTDFPTPVVEGGGSSAGLKKFCEGVGENTIDIANASRAIKDSEIEACKAAGVTEIMEVRIGYDGIVFASEIKGPEFAFTPADIYGALASNVAKDGKIVPNTAKTWKDVKADFPAQNILMFIPGTKHGTREVFDTKVIEAGCKASGAYDLFKAASKGADDKAKEKDAVSACNDLRKDGASVEIDGDYTETLARIAAKGRYRRVRSVVLPEQHRQAARRHGERHHPLGRDRRQGRISGLAPALLLREEGAYRRGPGPAGIHRLLRLG